MEKSEKKIMATVTHKLKSKGAQEAEADDGRQGEL